MANTFVTEPQIAKDAVLTKSEKLPDGTPIVKGYEWNNGIDYDELFRSYLCSGFQATNFGEAINQINKMVRHHSFHNDHICVYFGQIYIKYFSSVRLSRDHNTR